MCCFTQMLLYYQLEKQFRWQQESMVVLNYQLGPEYYQLVKLNYQQQVQLNSLMELVMLNYQPEQ